MVYAQRLGRCPARVRGSNPLPGTKEMRQLLGAFEDLKLAAIREFERSERRAWREAACENPPLGGLFVGKSSPGHKQKHPDVGVFFKNRYLTIPVTILEILKANIATTMPTTA